MEEIIEKFKQLQRLSRTMPDSAKRTEVLRSLSKNLKLNEAAILEANQKDLEKMEKDNPLYDRLLLSGERIDGICGDVESVASLEDPNGQTLEERTLPNGLHLKRVSVPLGVVGVIYEARPNVTVDVFSLCFKAGNTVVLKGGSDAEESNKAIVKIIKKTLKENNLSEDLLYLMSADRKYVEVMLKADKYIDLIIPRGSQGLIRFVKENSLVPIIETGAGIVHTYIDEDFNLDWAREIIFNAKTQRPSVCNALDCLVISEKALPKLPEIVELLAKKEVIIYADAQSHAALEGKYPATLLEKAEEEHFGREFLSLQMAIKTVSNLNEAIEHINKYSSRHSEAIISNNAASQASFIKEVDAGVIYTNASTCFTDGGIFGLGAEIGISTQKLHARGPFALKALTTYKWILEGEGQVRR
ncbi:MAG: glutamate-5-semialdehyde dehydrogenase [Candidatus Gracilibacteria bacterium]